MDGLSRQSRTTRNRSSSWPAASPCPITRFASSMQAGRELGERQEGRLEFRGPSATRGYFHNEAQDPRAHSRRLARQRRPRLHGRRRRLHHRPDQGHHHSRGPSSIPPGDRRGRGRHSRDPQGWRRGFRRDRSSLRHRARGRSCRDARDRSGEARSTAGTRAGGHDRHRRDAAGRDRARTTEHRSQDIERQDPPQRRKRTLCERSHRPDATSRCGGSFCAWRFLGSVRR